MKDKDIFERAVTRFGRKNQTIVAIEELSELQKALTKIMRGGDDYESVAEEIADVEIMIGQLKYMFMCEQEVREKKVDKLLRLEKRIQRGLDHGFIEDIQGDS